MEILETNWIQSPSFNVDGFDTPEPNTHHRRQTVPYLPEPPRNKTVEGMQGTFLKA